MGFTKITELPSIFSGSVSPDDVLPIVDITTDETKKIQVDQLQNYILSGFTNNNWYIPSGTTEIIYTNTQGFIYGDLIIDGTLILEDNSQLVVLNGDVILTGGTISGGGTIFAVDLPEVDTYTNNVRLVGNILYFDRTDESSAYYIDLSYFKFTGNTLSTNINNIYVSNLLSPSSLTIHGKLQQNTNTATGSGNNIALGSNSAANGNTSFIYSTNSIVSGSRSVVLGGQNITGTTNDTVYVPNLNINTTPPTNNSLPNVLVRDYDGTIRLRDATSLGGSINYGGYYNLVLFVDAQYGNDSTGTINRFDKPYQTINQARYVASLQSRSQSNKVLIYIRAGYYYTDVNLLNWCDFYCEPNVVFGGGTVTDAAEPLGVTSNFFGYASFPGYYFANTLSITNQSTVNFEFDYALCNGRFCFIGGSLATPVVNIVGNYIYCLTYGTSYGVHLRNSSRTTMYIRRAIESLHDPLYIRTFSGEFNLTCPKIKLVTGNIYGGNSKSSVRIESTNPGSIIVINGDVVVSDTTYYGGISSAFTFWGSNNGSVELNGNIYGGVTLGVNGNNTGSGSFIHNGDIVSDRWAIWAYGNGKFLFRNGKYRVTGTVPGISSVFAINGTAEAHIMNCSLFNGCTGTTDTIEINSLTSNLIINNSVGKNNGSNYSITTSVGGGNLYVHSSRFDKIINPLLVDGYSPSGLIIDPNTKVPNF